MKSADEQKRQPVTSASWSVMTYNRLTGPCVCLKDRFMEVWRYIIMMTSQISWSVLKLPGCDLLALWSLCVRATSWWNVNPMTRFVTVSCDLYRSFFFFPLILPPLMTRCHLKVSHSGGGTEYNFNINSYLTQDRGGVQNDACMEMAANS